jgi:hypothetical protein
MIAIPNVSEVLIKYIFDLETIWFHFGNNKILTLLYQASKHGFSAEIFHKYCNNKGKTLTIIQEKNNSIVFGGYTSQSWDSFSGFKQDPEAFLFSLKNKNKTPLKLNVKNSKYAIYCDLSYGPSFGDFDLYVSSNSNKNKDSFLNVGCIYSNGSINRKNYNRNFIADSIYFSTKEIEIFQIG